MLWWGGGCYGSVGDVCCICFVTTVVAIDMWQVVVTLWWW